MKKLILSAETGSINANISARSMLFDVKGTYTSKSGSEHRFEVQLPYMKTGSDITITGIKGALEHHDSLEPLKSIFKAASGFNTALHKAAKVVRKTAADNMIEAWEEVPYGKREEGRPFFQWWNNFLPQKLQNFSGNANDPRIPYDVYVFPKTDILGPPTFSSVAFDPAEGTVTNMPFSSTEGHDTARNAVKSVYYDAVKRLSAGPKPVPQATPAPLPVPTPEPVEPTPEPVVEPEPVVDSEPTTLEEAWELVAPASVGTAPSWWNLYLPKTLRGKRGNYNNTKFPYHDIFVYPVKTVRDEIFFVGLILNKTDKHQFRKLVKNKSLSETLKNVKELAGSETAAIERRNKNMISEDPKTIEEAWKITPKPVSGARTPPQKVWGYLPEKMRGKSSNYPIPEKDIIMYIFPYKMGPNVYWSAKGFSPSNRNRKPIYEGVSRTFNDMLKEIHREIKNFPDFKTPKPKAPPVPTKDLKINIGDIFVYSFGYNQTRHYFLQVVGMTPTKKSVWVRPIYGKTVSGSIEGGNARVVPVPNDFTERGKKTRHKMNYNPDGTPRSFKYDRQYAYPYDENSKYHDSGYH